MMHIADDDVFVVERGHTENSTRKNGHRKHVNF